MKILSSFTQLNGPSKQIFAKDTQASTATFMYKILFRMCEKKLLKFHWENIFFE